MTWSSENIEIENAFVQPDIDFNFCVILSADLEYATDQAGHMVQNMMLAAIALELGVAPIGGFKDDYINQQVLKDDLSAFYLVPVGEASVLL